MYDQNGTSNETDFNFFIGCHLEPKWCTFTTEDIVLLICFVSMFLLGTVGNLLTIKYFGFGDGKKLAGSLQILFLAVNDFLSSIIVPVAQIMSIIKRSIVSNWDISPFPCYTLVGAVNLLLTASSWFLVAISAERLR